MLASDWSWPKTDLPGYSCMSLQALVRRPKWLVECVEQQRFRFLEVWLLFCSQILDHCTPGEEGPSADSGLVLLKISGFLKRCVWSFVPKLTITVLFVVRCVCRVRWGVEERGKIHKSTWCTATFFPLNTRWLSELQVTFVLNLIVDLPAARSCRFTLSASHQNLSIDIYRQ